MSRRLLWLTVLQDAYYVDLLGCGSASSQASDVVRLFFKPAGSEPFGTGDYTLRPARSAGPIAPQDINRLRFFDFGLGDLTVGIHPILSGIVFFGQVARLVRIASEKVLIDSVLKLSVEFFSVRGYLFPIKVLLISYLENVFVMLELERDVQHFDSVSR